MHWRNAPVASSREFKPSRVPVSTVKTYSQLFVRCFTKRHQDSRKRQKAAVKHIATSRLNQEFRLSKPIARRPLAEMAQVMSPGAVMPPQALSKDEEWSENLNVRLICKDCREDPPNLYEDHASGDLLCDSCGLVLQQRSIDQSSEWRTFSNDDQGNDDPSRVGDGPNALLNGAQLNTNIAFGDGGMRSRDLNRAQNKVNLDKGNKNLLQAYKQIGALCDGWQLPTIVSDTAKYIYKDADESRLFKGKNMDVLTASCVFIACRRHKYTRSFREAMELTRVSKKEIGRTFKALEQFLHRLEQEKKGTSTMLGGGLVVSNEQYHGSGSTDPSELCPRYCSDLNLDQRTSNIAAAVVENMKKIGALAGRSPLSATAACIFMACQLTDKSRTAKEIGEIARVSDSTIRGAYKILYKDRGRLVTEELLLKGADISKLVDPRSAEERAADGEK